MFVCFQSDDGDNSEDVPKPDDSYNIDIPGSVTLWEARPRPPNSAQVCKTCLTHIKLLL